jgi:hypothetical protein
LCYFENQDQKKELGQIYLDQAAIRVCTENLRCIFEILKPATDTDKQYIFDVVTKLRVFHLGAQTQKDMNEWMKILSKYTILHNDNEPILQVKGMNDICA